MQESHDDDSGQTQRACAPPGGRNRRWLRSDSASVGGLPETQSGAGRICAGVCAKVGSSVGHGAVPVPFGVWAVVARGGGGVGLHLVSSQGARVRGVPNVAFTAVIAAATTATASGVSRHFTYHFAPHQWCRCGSSGTHVSAIVTVFGVRWPLQQCATFGRRLDDSL